MMEAQMFALAFSEDEIEALLSACRMADGEKFGDITQMDRDQQSAYRKLESVLALSKPQERTEGDG